MLSSILRIANMWMKQYFIYKSNFFLFTINRIVEVVVYIFIWLAIYNQTGEINGLNKEQMVTYYILVVSLTPMVLWGINEDMAYSIRKGNVARELLNPISYFSYWFGHELGEIFFGALTSIATFGICAILWGVIFPSNIINGLLFALIVILNIPIIFFMIIITGLTGFYTNSIWGMQIFRKSIISIFSGLIAPLSLFPEWFQSISNFLPFKELVDTPINIWLGLVNTDEVIFVIVKQIIWSVIMYIIAKMFFKKAIKNVTVNGG